MKIVDEKGKLFGKINLIDLLAIIILVAAVVLLAARFLAPSGPAGKSETAKLTYTVQAQAVDQATYDQVLRFLAEGEGKDQLMANGELVDGAYVVGVEATPHINYNTDANGQTVVAIEDYDNGRLDLLFTVEAQVEDATTSLVGTQEVRVAKSHILKTTHFEFPYTLVQSCTWDNGTSGQQGA